MTTTRKKPTLAETSPPCCGECSFCHPIPENKKDVGCYVEPPEYLYGEAEIADWAAFKPIAVTRPICHKFKPKNGGH